MNTKCWPEAPTYDIRKTEANYYKTQQLPRLRIWKMICPSLNKKKIIPSYAIILSLLGLSKIKPFKTDHAQLCNILGNPHHIDNINVDDRRENLVICVKRK